MSNWSFDNAYKVTSFAMNIIRTHPFSTKNRIWRIQLYALTVTNILCLYFLVNSVFFHDAKSGKYTDASKNFAILIISFNSNMKYYTMIYCRESIGGLISTMNRDYENAMQFGDEEKNIVLKYITKSITVSKFWAKVSTCTCALFPVKAFCLMFYYYSKGESQLVPMFDFTFPAFIDRNKLDFLPFVGIFALCFFFDMFAGLVYMGFEPLIPIFSLHVGGQLELLSFKIEKVISESENEDEMKEKMKSINMKLQELYGFINHVQTHFRFLMELNMKGTTVILPCNAFLVLQEFRNDRVLNVEFLCLLLASFVHFLSPCYFSDLLIESSDSFRQAIYKSGWENCRYMSIRKTVLLMLTRTGKPFSISTIFYFISLDTFSTMCRHAYAIFNLMTAAWS